MVEAGLSPRDPARWWLAVAVERERDQQRQQDGQNIKVVE